MAAAFRLGVAAIALIAQASANPLERRQTCMGQSCVVANIAGNTGVPIDPTMPPTGDTYQGDCCVLTYNPAAKQFVNQFNPKLNNCKPTYDRRSLDDSVEEMSEDQFMWRRAVLETRAAALEDDLDMIVEEEQEVNKRAACTAKTLIYARGTFEPGTLGVTVGPALSKAVKAGAPAGTWTVTGVDFMPTVQADYCLGLPGGVEAKKLLTSVAQSCPKTKIVMAGYSQGAMVVRNGLGNSTVQNRVAGLVTFGDPFDGAQVKNYKGPIQTYCAQGDGVCTGQFQISAAHLSYNMDVAGAAKIINAF